MGSLEPKPNSPNSVKHCVVASEGWPFQQAALRDLAGKPLCVCTCHLQRFCMLYDYMFIVLITLMHIQMYTDCACVSVCAHVHIYHLPTYLSVCHARPCAYPSVLLHGFLSIHPSIHPSIALPTYLCPWSMDVSIPESSWCSPFGCEAFNFRVVFAPKIAESGIATKDCTTGYSDSWPAEQKAWCCNLPTLVLHSTAGLPCEALVATMSLQSKRGYHAAVACPDRPGARYNCDAGYENWLHGWSQVGIQ